MKKYSFFICSVCLAAGLIFLLLFEKPGEAGQAKKPYRVMALLPSKSNLFWKGVWSGIGTSSRECSYSLSEYECSDINEANQLLDIAERTAVDGVFLCPKGDPDDTFYLHLENLRQRGTKIVLLDTPIPEDSYDAFVGIDNANAGSSIAQYLCDQPEPEQPIILLHSSSPSGTTLERTDGLCSTLESAGLPLQVCRLAKTPDSPEGIADIMAIINKHEGLLYLVACTPNYTLKAASAAALSNASDRVHVIGFGETAEAFHYVENGVIQALFVQDNIQLGQKSAEIMEKLLQKETVPVKNEIDINLVTTENVQSYTDDAP